MKVFFILGKVTILSLILMKFVFRIMNIQFVILNALKPKLLNIQMEKVTKNTNGNPIHWEQNLKMF